MAWHAEAIYGSTTAVVSAIHTFLTDAGWTASGTTPNYTFTNPSATRDRTIQFYISVAGATNFTFTMNANGSGSGNSANHSLLINSQSSTANFRLTMACGPNHVMIVIEGPRNGESYALDATYGSDKNFFFMGSVNSYFTADNDLDALVLGGTGTMQSAGGSRTSNPRFLIMKGMGGQYWAEAELRVLKGMTEYPGSGAGEYPPSIESTVGGVFVSPIVVMETVGGTGVRGVLRELFWASPSEPGSGESNNPYNSLPEMLINGVLHNQIRPVHPAAGDTTYYSPFGQGQKTAMASTSGYAGGPVMYVRSA